MLHDQLPFDEIVDSEAALEFVKEATKLASATELEDIADRLGEKSAVFAELLAADRVHELDEVSLRRLLGHVFSWRRKGGRLLRAHDLAGLRASIADLLYARASPGERLESFAAALDGVESGMAISLGSEILHFTEPRRYWLWTPWLWNPQKRTGALALVLRDQVELGGSSPAETYANIGRAMAQVDAQGHAVGYSWSGRGLFGTDVFLAAVYAVYMYTVFRVRLSQEFNRILPELPELVRRVLGVHRPGENDGR